MRFGAAGLCELFGMKHLSKVGREIAPPRRRGSFGYSVAAIHLNCSYSASISEGSTIVRLIQKSHAYG